MNSKEIKTAVSNLDKAKDDATVLEILGLLERDVRASETLLRVSFFRSCASILLLTV